MKSKKAHIELAIIKGVLLALGVVGAFFVYETMKATTSEGNSIECKWDCSEVSWSTCIEGFSYRDITFCKVNEPECR